MRSRIKFLSVIVLLLLSVQEAVAEWQISSDWSRSNMEAYQGSGGTTLQIFKITVPEGKCAYVNVTLNSLETVHASMYRFKVIHADGSSSILDAHDTDWDSLTSSGVVQVMAEVVQVEEHEVVHTGPGGYPWLEHVPWSTYYVRGYFDIEVTYETLVPDLAISAFSTLPEREVSLNEAKSLKFTVKNVGGKPASATTARLYDGTAKLKDFSVPALAVGGTAEFAYDLSALAARDHKLKVSIDSVTEERFMDNNSKTVELAVYENVPYVVRFDPAGGGGSPVDQDMTYGVRKALRSNSFVRNGYIFTGWSEPIGGIRYSDGQVVANLSHERGRIVTLYAVWRKAPVIHFDGMGTQGVMTDVQMTSDRITLPANRFVREGKEFVGWSRFPHTAPLYADGQTVSLKALTSIPDGDSAETITLYAAWGKPFTYRGIAFYTGGSDDVGWDSGWFWHTGGSSRGLVCGWTDATASEWLCARLTGAGTLEFTVCAKRSGGSDSFTMTAYENDSVQNENVWSHEADWVMSGVGYRMPFMDGVHLLGWNWSGKDGAACVLDNMEWYSGHVVTLDACGGNLVQTPANPYVIEQDARDCDGLAYCIACSDGRYTDSLVYEDIFQWGSDFPISTRNGYSLDGWYTAATGGQKVETVYDMPDDVTRLYAHWTWTNPGPPPPAKTTVTVTYDANGGTVGGKAAKAVELTPGNLFGKLPAAAKSESFFIGWYTARSGGSPVTASSTVPSAARTYYARWTRRLSLTGSLDGSGLAWESDSWGGQAAETHDGADAVRSGYVTDGRSTYLETRVSGPGTVTFWWKVSCEGSGKDALRFLADGTQRAVLTGEIGWTRAEVAVTGSGEHVLKWNYTKDGSGTKGEDCGWVDEVRWTPRTTDLFKRLRYPPIIKISDLSGSGVSIEGLGEQEVSGIQGTLADGTGTFDFIVGGSSGEESGPSYFVVHEASGEWWSAECEAIPAGDRIFLVLDNGETYILSDEGQGWVAAKGL